ncbi:MAG: hypothetical protein ABSE73_27970, partial [Planctomycetota bacterium]
MKHFAAWWSIAMCTALSLTQAEDASALRLVPFPKEITLQAGWPGTCALDGPLVLEAPDGPGEVLLGLLADELRRAGWQAPTLRALGKDALWIRLSREGGGGVPVALVRDHATPEDYSLNSWPGGIICTAPGQAGLF